MQGNQNITLDPGPASTLTIAGVIADQGGSGGAGVAGIIVSGGGTVQLDAVNTYTGTMGIGGGTTLEIGASGSATGSIAYFPAPAPSS